MVFYGYRLILSCFFTNSNKTFERIREVSPPDGRGKDGVSGSEIPDNLKTPAEADVFRFGVYQLCMERAKSGPVSAGHRRAYRFSYCAQRSVNKKGVPGKPGTRLCVSEIKNAADQSRSALAEVIVSILFFSRLSRARVNYFSLPPLPPLHFRGGYGIVTEVKKGFWKG